MKFKEVVEKIKPSREEERKVNSVTSELKRNLEKAKDVTVIIGGSDAKGTVIKSKPRRDIDVFVAFDYNKYSDRTTELSDILAAHLRKLRIPFKRIHGSRDYFHFIDKKNNMFFEIVPILHIRKSSDAVNITDISPLHVTYVKKNLKRKNVSDDIRLAKALCYSHRIYGAESHIRAFSGYALEILVIHYGGFMNFLRAGAKWKKQLHKGKLLIDPEKHYNNKDAIIFHLNESKLTGPLILIDPVQKERNVTAAMDEEKFSAFIDLCQKFVKNPSLKFFEKKEIKADQLRKTLKKKEDLVTLPLDLGKGKEDILGSRMRKLFDFLVLIAERAGFSFRKKIWTFYPERDVSHFYFIVENPILDTYEEKQGPPIKIKKAVQGFKKKWGKTYTKKGRLYTKVKRKFIKFDLFLKNSFEEKVKSEKSLKIIKRAVCV